MQTYTSYQYLSSPLMDKMTSNDKLHYNPLKDTAIKLRELINKHGLSARQFAERVGMAPEQVSRYLSGKNNPYQHTLEKIKRAFPDFNYTETDTRNEAEFVTTNDFVLLPVPLIREYAYAGYMSGFHDPEFIDNLDKIPFMVDKFHKGKYIALEVRGDSMDDGSVDSLLSGDILLCREIGKNHWGNKLHIRKWDFVIVHKTEGILVKRITKHDTDSGIIVAHSLNDFYEDIELNLKDVAQLFNVIKVERTKK